MAPSRHRAPRIGTNALFTIRRGHEFIHVYDADFAQRVFFPHEYFVGLGLVSADHQQFHRGSSYRFELGGSVRAVYNQTIVEGDAEVIVKNKSPFIEKRGSDEREGIVEVIVENTSPFIMKRSSDERKGVAEVIVKNQNIFEKRSSVERERVAEVIVKNKSVFIEKRSSDEREGVAEVIVKT